MIEVAGLKKKKEKMYSVLANICNLYVYLLLGMIIYFMLSTWKAVNFSSMCRETNTNYYKIFFPYNLGSYEVKILISEILQKCTLSGVEAPEVIPMVIGPSGSQFSFSTSSPYFGTLMKKSDISIAEW